MSKIIIIALLCFTSFNINAQSPKLEIRRMSITDKCIAGYLLVNDSVICYTLELPYIDNINFISSIKPGTYEASIKEDGQLGWRIKLKNVPGRDDILIHIGNYKSDITGCTLLGTDVDINNCTVSHSRDALDKVGIYFNKYIDNKIKVVYSNPY